MTTCQLDTCACVATIKFIFHDGVCYHVVWTDCVMNNILWNISRIFEGVTVSQNWMQGTFGQQSVNRIKKIAVHEMMLSIVRRNTATAADASVETSYFWIATHLHLRQRRLRHVSQWLDYIQQYAPLIVNWPLSISIITPEHLSGRWCDTTISGSLVMRHVSQWLAKSIAAIHVAESQLTRPL